MARGNNTLVRASRSDADVIATSLADPTEFVALFDRYSDQLNRYLRRRVGKEAADELTSETFAQAFEHRQRYDTNRPDARPWLYGIAHNLLRHHYRDEARALRAYGSRTLDSPVSDSDAAFDGVSAALASTALADALAALSNEERDVLLLIAWAELDYKEAAVALGIPVGTVRSRLNRARKRIRELLGRSGQYEKERI
jgi:RNA polymerase sigma factor (sigma-70 family)